MAKKIAARYLAENYANAPTSQIVLEYDYIPFGGGIPRRTSKTYSAQETRRFKG